MELILEKMLIKLLSVAFQKNVHFENCRAQQKYLVIKSVIDREHKGYLLHY